mmetsp:Transcript_7054/g.19910  ORF Transcript_7054/g.19910 Transcript_7054/m.19910 type:complete len:422 (-) Transcript_7054:3034-4299(-)
MSPRVMRPSLSQSKRLKSARVALSRRSASRQREDSNVAGCSGPKMVRRPSRASSSSASAPSRSPADWATAARWWAVSIATGWPQPKVARHWTRARRSSASAPAGRRTGTTATQGSHRRASCKASFAWRALSPAAAAPCARACRISRLAAASPPGDALKRPRMSCWSPGQVAFAEATLSASHEDLSALLSPPADPRRRCREPPARAVHHSSRRHHRRERDAALTPSTSRVPSRRAASLTACSRPNGSAAAPRTCWLTANTSSHTSLLMIRPWPARLLEEELRSAVGTWKCSRTRLRVAPRGLASLQPWPSAATRQWLTKAAGRPTCRGTRRSTKASFSPDGPTHIQRSAKLTVGTVAASTFARACATACSTSRLTPACSTGRPEGAIFCRGRRQPRRNSSPNTADFIAPAFWQSIPDSERIS